MRIGPAAPGFVIALGLAVSFAAAPLGSELKPAEAFAGIADPGQRAIAVFEEAGKVLRHPRCMNCHPDGDRPTQGADFHPHYPPVMRGEDGHGVAGLRCSACHPAENYDAAKVPGNPKWGLAPIEMAWQGKSLGEICEQIKDPVRNGGRSLAEIVDHTADDDLVAWGWAPGAEREAAPGTQAVFGGLIKAWVDAGAGCPAQQSRP